MDLLSSIRKSGSRGGVNFSWDEVQTSQHRENYLGHSLMAPVGRWQKGRDLNWYAKGDEEGKDGETADEKRIRERKEEIRRIKEAEEDAMSKALGLPVADRGVTGANAVSVGEVNRMVKEAGVGDEDEKEDVGKATGFGDFVGKVMNPEGGFGEPKEAERGGLVRKGRERQRDGKKDERRRSGSRERRHRRRHRSRSGERHRRRSRSPDRYRDKPKREDRARERSRSPRRREPGYRARSPPPKREDRSPNGSRSPKKRERDYRARSPDRPRASNGDGTYRGEAYRGDSQRDDKLRDDRKKESYRPRRSPSPDRRNHGRRDGNRDHERRRY
ncbi:hypothetical protein GLAREA_01007 [Glarea lozoyensis ATCC 20868]|uniref:Multiple myeloma tumor-associated protein 2-like N-terminal domain-containing protein n=1 Tax=Glarea lozoyensis (strain ATCC 20868 / MF5171) TaxID=1116229 RepID=S3CTY6_GLAL2|nr:uncharacterized protein GLAREA_01007 [Glarea lozoyensis ATCC 20868]EPE29847.1 hypothetical protein GLAREA_01007 [Glarea lozoyensis ATCC 20868]